MKQKPSFLIIDDHLVIRRGLTFLLKDRFPASTIESTDQSNVVLSKIKNQPYDLLIQDLALPKFEPLSFINMVLTFQPKQSILVYSMSPEELFTRRVLNLGAKGYLEKSASESTLFKAIDTILKGGR
ncbi:MAG: response regulator transcription factor, partial [Cyclobacteriaceae bacterium]